MYIKSIILNQKVDISSFLINREYGFIVRDGYGLLHFYDFETGKFEFKWKHIIYIIWELCGLFIILPIFILSTIAVSIILPLLLFVMYFYIFSTKHSFTYLDYLTDFSHVLFIN